MVRWLGMQLAVLLAMLWDYWLAIPWDDWLENQLGFLWEN